MSAVTVSSKGQIVLPKDLRRELGIEEGERLEVSERGGEIVLRRVFESTTQTGWRVWRGSLAGTGALEEHQEEHRKEAQK